MSGLEKSLFQLKALAQDNVEGARIYAANSIRKKNESLNLLRLSSRIDAVASRVETAVAMRQVTGNMTSVVKGLDRAMQTMDLERISMVMDKFENQLEDVDVQTSYMESTMGSTTATGMPQDQVDTLMQQVADQNGIELNHQLGEARLEGKVAELPTGEADKQKAQADTDEALAQRLRALRPAT
ncbi:hypothetical protein CBS14141_000480 [Malassezia furfur]|nr:hypothetical protein CBS14141_000480 [Malassezia furfur]